jgi:hypothetical protein
MACWDSSDRGRNSFVFRSSSVRLCFDQADAGERAVMSLLQA